MADRTQFADLTRLAPQDPLSADGYGLQLRNPTLIDYFLRLLFTGKHDGHAKLGDPAVAPTLTVDDTGGHIAADQAITVGYTLTDADGGETALSPLGDITTRASLIAPDTGPALAADFAAGTLLAGSYDYAVTLTDGLGGETTLSPINTILVPAGHTNARILVTGLDAILGSGAGAAGWRLWRSINDEDWHLIGTGADGSFTDDGSHAADCGVSPPQFEGTTNATSVLHVTVPGGQGARTVSYSIYASVTGAFDQPSLLGTYPVAEINTVKSFTDLTFLAVTPPETSTAMPGLPKITAAELASGAGGGGGGGGGDGGGGGAGPLSIRPPWYMAPPGSIGPPSAADAIVWQENGVNRAAIYAEWAAANDVYALEAYNGGFDPSQFAGDIAHFHTDDNGDVTLADAGDWHVSVAPGPANGLWVNASVGGYTEFDYHIVNDNWATISADLQSLGTPGAGVRAIIDRASATFSLVNLATDDVIASVGAAEGFELPTTGQGGYIVVAIHNDHCTAFDGRTQASFISVSLDPSIPLNQAWGGWGISSPDVTSVVADYWSFGESALSRVVYVGTYQLNGVNINNAVALWTEDGATGGGLRVQDWQFLTTGASSPYPAENGWANPVASGTDWLRWRMVEGADELQIRGTLDGTAATSAVFGHVPNSVQIQGDTEHPAVLVAGDGTRSTCYIKVGYDRSLSLVQPAVPLPAGSTLHFSIVVPLS